MPAVHYTNRYMLKPEFTGNAFLIEDPDLMGPILSRKSWWIDQFPNLPRPSDE